MNTEDKKLLSETVRNYVVATGLVVGGLWAGYVFHSKVEVETAHARLEKINLELAQRPVIIPRIDVFAAKTDSSDSWRLKIMIELENRGNADAELILSDEAVMAAKVDIEQGAVSGFRGRIYGGLLSIPLKGEDSKSFERIVSLTLLAGQKKTAVSLLEVDGPGLYVVQFRATPSLPILIPRRKVEEIEGKHVVAIKDYVIVGGSPNNGFQPTTDGGG